MDYQPDTTASKLSFIRLKIMDIQKKKQKHLRWLTAITILTTATSLVPVSVGIFHPTIDIASFLLLLVPLGINTKGFVDWWFIWPGEFIALDDTSESYVSAIEWLTKTFSKSQYHFFRDGVIKVRNKKIAVQLKLMV